jgi:hypothetical protein
MLSPNTVFRKTELGTAEVAARKMGLRAELRRVLILIDGRNTVSKLATFVRVPEIEALIYELQAQGLIDSADGAPLAVPPTATSVTAALAASATPAASTAMPAAAAVPAATDAASFVPTQEQFVAARNAAVRHVNDTLGPGGEALAMKLERTHNAQELRQAVTEVRHSIDRAVGEAAGQRFLESVRSAAAKN